MDDQKFITEIKKTYSEKGQTVSNEEALKIKNELHNLAELVIDCYLAQKNKK